MLAISARAPPGRPWIAAEDEPLAHVGAEDVELPVAIEVDEAHVRHRRRAGHSGMAIARRVNDSGVAAGCGQASGGGRRSGARLM